MQESDSKGLPEDTTVERYMEYYLPRALHRHAEKLPDFDVRLQLAIGPSGADPGGEWLLKVDAKQAAVERGRATPDAPCTISTCAADWMDLVRGRLNGPLAFMTGRIKVKGDYWLALQLGQMLMSALASLK